MKLEKKRRRLDAASFLEISISTGFFLFPPPPPSLGWLAGSPVLFFFCFEFLAHHLVQTLTFPITQTRKNT